MTKIKCKNCFGRGLVLDRFTYQNGHCEFCNGTGEVAAPSTSAAAADDAKPYIVETVTAYIADVISQQYRAGRLKGTDQIEADHMASKLIDLLFSPPHSAPVLPHYNVNDLPEALPPQSAAYIPAKGKEMLGIVGDPVTVIPPGLAPEPPARKMKLSKGELKMLKSLPRNLADQPLKGYEKITARTLSQKRLVQVLGVLAHQRTLARTDAGRQALAALRENGAKA